MSPPFADLNWLAIIVAAVAAMVAGAIWGAPFLKLWADAHGVDVKETSSNPLMWGLGFVVQVATAIVFDLIFAAVGIAQIGSAIIWAALIGIGLVFLEVLVHNLTLKKPFGLTLGEGGARVVQFLAIAVILALWR